MDKERDTSGDSARVVALLGPTNTGKTHRAIERMLDFESGMMGLPLRLLAREVYDRVTARLGEQAVALVTGEEKRVPPRARYWVCTVEAMPLDIAVDFMAVDEIQLVAHPERGHVFTDRLLHVRGRAETWFLGSDTAEALVREWVPGVRMRRLPRLSHLSYKGQSSLRTLPRRSAVVAFNMPQVYELADALRSRRGGAAVVLGALSPRVRNAQVALYQAGEVDFLVATDAIGMGLNLDIDHVALASRVKFDGFETRALDSAELAQIVGRAGRYLRDGTFGTLAPEPELAPRLVEQLEQHRFPLLRHGFYRNTDLDYTSMASLLRSLERRPKAASLRLAPEGDDMLVLRLLAKKAEVSALADRPSRLRVLWDVCRIPNYEKRIPEHQAERLWPLFEQLAKAGCLSGELVAQNVQRLERYDGDIHVLMDRLSAVRTWTYVSHQGGWVEGAEDIRARTRALEDRLSDVLHERLLERFVRTGSAPRRSRERAAASVVGGSAGHHPFAKLAELDIYQHPEREAERRRDDWVELVIAARFHEFDLTTGGELRVEGQRVARLVPGQSLLRPALRLTLPDWVPGGARVRIERRLVAHVRDLVSHLLEPLELDVRGHAPLRGVLYQLEQGLGTVPKRAAAAQLAVLDEAARALLHEHGIVIGRCSLYARAMLDATRLRVRHALCRAAEALGTRFEAPPLDAVIWALPRNFERELCLRLGFVPLSSWAVRCDVLETLLERAGDPARPTEHNLEEARFVLGGSDEQARSVLRELSRARRRRRRTRRPA